MGETVILTSDTPEATQAFYDQRLNLAPPEPVAATEKVEPAVESEPEKKPTEPAAEGDGEDVEQHIPNPEVKNKVHVRFSELTEARKAAEARALEAQAKADAAETKRAMAEAEAASLRSKYEPPKAEPVGPKPQRSQFVNDEEFEKALEDHVTEKVTWEREQTDRTAKVQAAFQARTKAAQAAIPDYDAAIDAASELLIPIEIEHAIYESDVGPQILHHLAKNPDVVAKIASATKDQRLRIFGRLEGKFETAPSAVVNTPAPAKEEVKPVVVAAEISRAPAPIVPLKSSKSTPDLPEDANGNWYGTHEEYKRARKAGKI